MSGFLTLTLVLTILFLLPQLLPPVTELPFGLDPYLTTFTNQVDLLISSAPWLATVWNVVLIGLTIKFTLFGVSKMWNIIRLIRGGG